MITIDPPSSSLTSPPALSKSALTRFLHRAVLATGLEGKVDVLLTTDAELKRLNRIFRGKNKPTDVLSFPAELLPGLPVEHQRAGDLAVSLETAARQAVQFRHSLDLEIRILLLHGLLHLAGHDHESDSGEMASLERHLRSTLKLPLGLIDRAHVPLPNPAGPAPDASPAPHAAAGSIAAVSTVRAAGTRRTGTPTDQPAKSKVRRGGTR